jgi:hypothetical protein
VVVFAAKIIGAGSLQVMLGEIVTLSEGIELSSITVATRESEHPVTLSVITTV